MMPVCFAMLATHHPSHAAPSLLLPSPKQVALLLGLPMGAGLGVGPGGSARVVIAQVPSP